MNDPWDVKSVRQSNQYMSCMKINGVPLLPPVVRRDLSLTFEVPTPKNAVRNLMMVL